MEEGEKVATSESTSEKVGHSSAKNESRKRPAPAQSEQSSLSSPSSAIVSAEGKTDTKTSVKVESQSIGTPKAAFVPNYEPIQTRKRAKTSQHTATFPNANVSGSGSSNKKEPVQKVSRSRLTKDEVYTPDVGPRPKAVPKSLLILEPGLLPRSVKKKQARLASTVQIHTSAMVSKSPSVSWPSSSQSNDAVSTDMTKPPMSTSLEMSSVLLENDSSSEMKQAVAQDEDGTASYILTEVASDNCPASFITVSDGQIMSMQAVSGMGEEQAVSYTVISEESNNSTNEKKGDTPTSLLLLAEAAYPSTAGSQTPSVVTSATQSPVKTVVHPGGEVTIDQQNKAKTSQAKTAPTYVTISCEGGTSRIVSSSSEVQPVTLNPASDVPSSQWTCTVCGELMNETDREQHLTQHLDAEEEDDFVCETCGEQLKDEEDLELHMAVEHDEEEGENEDFGFDEDEDEKNMEENEQGHSVTGSTSSPTTVLTTVASTPVHTCQQCGETFAFAAYLRQHMKEAHTDAGTLFSCLLCPMTFTSKTALENHGHLHQTAGRSVSFKCVRCSQIFSSAALLSNHARSCLTKVMINTKSTTQERGHGRGGRRSQGRSRTASHACSVCNKTFTSEVYLKAHQLSHETSEGGGDSMKRSKTASGLQCLFCEEKFRHIGSLKEHMLASHPKAFPFKCSVCQRGFSRDSSRVAHEQTHQTEKLHFCSECGEGFVLQTYLNRHMKYRHLKPTKLPCRVCHKEFVRQADLIRHIRVHTGEKPYTCELCGHGFGQQSNYRYHMMRHRGEKPHMCPMCNKGFRVPSHLKMHMQQHLNERFNCPYCDKVFSQSRYLHRHIRTHTNARHGRNVDQLLPASSASTLEGSATETVMVYDGTSTQPAKIEQQIVVDSVADVSEHVVVQDSTVETERVIQFSFNEEDEGDARGLAVVDEDRIAMLKSPGTTASNTCDTGQKADGSDSVQIEPMEERAYVNADEGRCVVVGAFSEGEGGSMEEGNVTLPFKDLTQLLGGKLYNCDVCSESFSIRPNSTYNMIHTGQSHILVINLNDHHHQLDTDS